MTLEVPIPTIRERPATHNGLWKCSSCKKPNPKSFREVCRNGLLNTLLPPYQAFKLLNCGIAQAMQTLMPLPVYYCVRDVPSP